MDDATYVPAVRNAGMRGIIGHQKALKFAPETTCVSFAN